MEGWHCDLVLWGFELLLLVVGKTQVKLLVKFSSEVTLASLGREMFRCYGGAVLFVE